jgi:hypothetical protein
VRVPSVTAMANDRISPNRMIFPIALAFMNVVYKIYTRSRQRQCAWRGFTTFLTDQARK